MAKERVTRSKDSDEKKARVRKPRGQARARERVDGSAEGGSSLASLQHQLGNQAVQRLLAQRSGGTDGPFELDEDTAGRINSQRGGGQPLEGSLQAGMGAALGQDLSGVRVHTSPEDDALNRQVGAKAFTTGQDIFFREGAYDPHSSGGQELLAHELTHVAQQSGASAPGGGRMVVNAPGDAYEQQAEASAKAITGPGAAAARSPGSGIQRQEMEKKDEETMQKAEAEEKDEQAVQKAEVEEDQVQRQELEKKDEEMMQKAEADEEQIQRQEVEEKDEEMVQKAAAEEEEQKV
jgi:hypothetical protein